MDLDQLRTFIEVARLRSFSRAAEKVLRSQPTVSAQVRQLEQEYGQKFLDRTAKSVRLTPAGEMMLEYAKQMLALRSKSLEALSDCDSHPAGTLSIGANEGTFLYVLPQVFAKFHKKYPAVRISVYRNFSYKVIEKVEDGLIDLAVVTLPVKSPALEVVSIFREPLMLMVSSANPLAGRKSVSLAELAQQPIVMPKTGSIRKMIEKHLRPHREHLCITMELSSVVMIKRFVGAGFGVSLICSTFARDNVQRGEVKLLKIEGLDLWRELGLVYRKQRSLPRSASAFMELAKKELLRVKQK